MKNLVNTVWDNYENEIKVIRVKSQLVAKNNEITLKAKTEKEMVALLEKNNYHFAFVSC